MKLDEELQTAIGYFQDGHLQEAAKAFSEILILEPFNSSAYLFLGIINYRLGNHDFSIEFLKKTLEIDTDNSIAHYNLGIAYSAKGQFDKALDCYKITLNIDPNFAAAYYNIGNILIQNRQAGKAIEYFKNAIRLNPNFEPAYYNLGNIFMEMQQTDDAIDCYRNALKIDPNFVFAFNNLGNALREKGKLDEAIACYQKVLNLDPGLAQTYTSLGLALHEKGMISDALNNYQIALKLDPALPEAHWNLAHIFLLRGNFKKGWEEFEWRWKLKGYYQYKIFQPQWDGSNISGLTILIHDEQGFGDTIQFARYIPMVAQKGARVIIGCRKELVNLLKNVEGVSKVIERGKPLPQFDIHCPIMSLPLKFNTTIEKIPAATPYISPDPLLIQIWRNLISHDDCNLKVGLVWAGRREHKNDRNRSGSFDIFSSLIQLNNISFYNLQKGEAAKQFKNQHQGTILTDYMESIHDFSETAALIENLDLVITVDTAVAHLAGALSKPVWTLLPFSPDWRWMLDREDSPWYPTMRLFRQPSPGDWESVIGRVQESLSGFPYS